MKTISTLSSLVGIVTVFGVAAVLYLKESYLLSGLLALVAIVSIGSWIKDVRIAKYISRWFRALKHRRQPS